MDQIRALRVFAEVASSGSFAAAARTLDLAPSVVTRQLAQLEKHLQARLLNRTTRSLELTDVGREYLTKAREILAALDDADSQAATSVSEPAGLLRVLCPPAFSVHQLCPLLHRFADRYRRITIELVADGSVLTADERFDVSVMSSVTEPVQGDFVAHFLACSDFIICASPQYLDRHGRPEHPDDLLQHRGALLDVSSIRRSVALYRAGMGTLIESESISIPTPVPTLSTTHIDSVLAAAVGGLGIAALPSFVAGEALRGRRLERLLPDWIAGRMKIYVAIPSRKHLPARTRVFIDFLKECFDGDSRDPWLQVPA